MNTMTFRKAFYDRYTIGLALILSVIGRRMIACTEFVDPNDSLHLVTARLFEIAFSYVVWHFLIALVRRVARKWVK